MACDTLYLNSPTVEAVDQTLLLLLWSKKRDKQWNQLLENNSSVNRIKQNWHLKEAFFPISLCDAVCSISARRAGTHSHTPQKHAFCQIPLSIYSVQNSLSLFRW